METSTILIVDKDETVSALLGAKLEDDSCDILRAEKSSEAIRILQEKKIRLLILNITNCIMPIEDIVPIVKGIDKDLPIIVTCETNYPDLESQVRAQKIFYYHIKSFGMSDLELAVNNAMAGSHARNDGYKEAE